MGNGSMGNGSIGNNGRIEWGLRGHVFVIAYAVLV